MEINEKVEALHRYLLTIFPKTNYYIATYTKEGVRIYVAVEKDNNIFCEMEIDNNHLITKTTWSTNGNTTP